MGMRVGGASSAGVQSAPVANWQQRQQSFQALTSALQSGNLSAAQQAFSSLGGTGNSQGSSPLAKLGQALQNGNLAGAQQALQTLQNARAGHHHHEGQSTVAAAPPAPSNAPAPTSSAPGSLINTKA